MPSKSSVRFLNHSCISVSSGTTTILCDPWFTGSAFDNGWRLLYEDSHDLSKVEYDWLWLSHEHPDHFSIPTLKQINRPTRFIYQATADRKVKAYLSKQHEVTEIEDFETKRFGDIDCQLFMCDGYDSAVLFRLPGGETVLNLNDCRVELGDLTERIAATVGPIDLLALQFSYANWAGNRGDSAIPAYQHEQVIKRLETVTDLLKPRAVLLFASYVFFSHEENFFWNDHFWLSKVMARLGPKVKLIVPKPDDVVMLDDLAGDFSDRNAEAVSFWAERHATRQIVDRARAKPSLDELRAQFKAFHEVMWRDNDLAFARSTSRKPLELVVRLTDQDVPVTLELFSGTMRQTPGATHDVELSSETLAMLFKNKFGRGTMTINGRIQFNYASAHRFFAFFFVYYANNIGRYLKPGGLTWPALHSIRTTSILDSIFKTTPSAEEACIAYLDAFIAPAEIAA